jgi:hypothetical protein
MILLGLILLIVGLVVGFHILFIVGAVLLVVGLILACLGYAGHGIAGRNHWWLGKKFFVGDYANLCSLCFPEIEPPSRPCAYAFWSRRTKMPKKGKYRGIGTRQVAQRHSAPSQ